MEIEWIVTPSLRQQKHNSKCQRSRGYLLVKDNEEGFWVSCSVCPPSSTLHPSLPWSVGEAGPNSASKHFLNFWLRLGGESWDIFPASVLLACGPRRGWTSLRKQTLAMDNFPWKQLPLASRNLASSLCHSNNPRDRLPTLASPWVLQHPCGSSSATRTSEDNPRQSFVQSSTPGVPFGPMWTLPDSGVPTTLQEADDVNFKSSRNQMIECHWVPFIPVLTFFFPTGNQLLQVSGNTGCTLLGSLVRMPQPLEMISDWKISGKESNWLGLSQVTTYG